MDTKDTFNFQIKGIEILETSLKYPKQKINNEIVFGFDLEVRHNYNIENNSISVICSVKVIDNKSKNEFGDLKVNFYFIVESLDKYFDNSTNNIKLPEGYVSMLNTISLSTMRGVMFGVFKGTFLNGAILPIINPTSKLVN